MNLPCTPIISADGHLNETATLIERLPKRYRPFLMPKAMLREDGKVDVDFLGNKLVLPRQKVLPQEGELTADELMCEFRTDPTGGNDLQTRLQYLARDGVCAEVIFPNLCLALGSTPDPEMNFTIAAAYNGWIHDIVSTMPERFVGVGIVPVDDLERAVAEVERCAKLGLRSVMLPCSFPWRPYDRPEYERLWSAIADLGLVLNFHTFTGNLYMGADFVALDAVTPEDFGRRVAAMGQLDYRYERLSTSVIGMAAGMGPIVHLTGSGVLERHPTLRFVVTEAEGGWLAWVLQSMDAMQDRRRLSLEPLRERASDYFRRQGAITITDDAVALHNLNFTGAECILWGSDYPHDEGTYPQSVRVFEAIRQHTTPEQAEAILAGNAARFYGFDLAKLAGGAAALTKSFETAPCQAESRSQPGYRPPVNFRCTSQVP